MLNTFIFKIGFLFFLSLGALFIYFGHNIEREQYIQKLEPHKSIEQIRKESFRSTILIILIYVILAFQEDFKTLIQFAGIIKK